MTVKMTTKQLILDEALNLFNKESVHDVSAHDIARKLNISSGNLTYYFKKKTNLIDGLSDQLLREIIEAAKALKEFEGNPEHMAEWFMTFSGLFWKYRFFFNNLMYISRKDMKQLNRYNKIKKFTVDALVDSHAVMVEKNVLKPVCYPNTVELLVENLWFNWVGNLRIFLIETPKKKASEKNYAYFANMHVYSFLEPYYTNKVHDAFYSYIQSHNQD